jgi:hypothetical protein
MWMNFAGADPRLLSKCWPLALTLRSQCLIQAQQSAASSCFFALSCRSAARVFLRSLTGSRRQTGSAQQFNKLTPRPHVDGVRYELALAIEAPTIPRASSANDAAVRQAYLMIIVSSSRIGV